MCSNSDSLKYTKKPVTIEAFQWTGDMFQTEDPEWICNAIQDGSVYFSNCSSGHDVKMKIETLEGTMTANVNDYIIQGVNGEIYPCKPDIFEKTYSKATSNIRRFNTTNICDPDAREADVTLQELMRLTDWSDAEIEQIITLSPEDVVVFDSLRVERVQ